MKYEIKEILDKAKEISKYGDDGKQHTRFFNQFEAKSLLDYITNLQEEITHLDSVNCHLRKKINNDVYKQRTDKAIEYIHNHQLVFELSSKEEIQKWFDDFYKDLLNILRGENNESN